MPTPTKTPPPVIFANVMPITTVVVALGTTYTFWVVIPTFAFVLSLKVFAMLNYYPKAIANATTSAPVEGATPFIFSVPVIVVFPWRLVVP